MSAALASQKASHMLGCLKSNVANSSRDGILPLYSALVRPHLESYIQLSAQERHGPVDGGPEEGTKMLRELEHLCYEERLRELGLFTLEKRRLREDLKAAFPYLQGASKQDEDRLLVGPVATGHRVEVLN